MKMGNKKLLGEIVKEQREKAERFPGTCLLEKSDAKCEFKAVAMEFLEMCRAAHAYIKQKANEIAESGDVVQQRFLFLNCYFETDEEQNNFQNIGVNEMANFCMFCDAFDRWENKNVES